MTRAIAIPKLREEEKTRENKRGTGYGVLLGEEPFRAASNVVAGQRGMWTV